MTALSPEKQFHNIEPFYCDSSRLLIVGSFPSPKSRETGFFYGHPSNRFWQVISSVSGYPVPCDIPQKKELLTNTGIALWDMAAECVITGASDSSIRDVIFNPIDRIVDSVPIRAAVFNGNTSYSLFRRSGISLRDDVAVFHLPSTSAANASFRLDKLISIWSEAIAPYINKI